MRRWVDAFGEAVAGECGGVVIGRGCGLWDLLLVSSAGIIVVVVAMVMAVVVVVCAGLSMVTVMMLVLIMRMPSSGAGWPGKQGGRGGGGEDFDATGSRRADLMDVFEQLVQRRHIHHCLGEGLLGVVVMWDDSCSSRCCCCCCPLIIGDLPLLREVQ